MAQKTLTVLLLLLASLVALSTAQFDEDAFQQMAPEIDDDDDFIADDDTDDEAADAKLQAEVEADAPEIEGIIPQFTFHKYFENRRKCMNYCEGTYASCTRTCRRDIKRCKQHCKKGVNLCKKRCHVQTKLQPDQKIHPDKHHEHIDHAHEEHDRNFAHLQMRETKFAHKIRSGRGMDEL